MQISIPFLLSWMVGFTVITTIPVHGHEDHDGPVKTYKADIQELDGSGVTGTVVVFQSDDDEGLVAYGGFASGLESSLDASTCEERNGFAKNIITSKRRGNVLGHSIYFYFLMDRLLNFFFKKLCRCGVHIHAGKGCENNEAQLVHYYVDPVAEDPWVDVRYSSNEPGDASFAGIVNIGTTDLIGRAFIGTCTCRSFVLPLYTAIHG
jgi:hypothetical protein